MTASGKVLAKLIEVVERPFARVVPAQAETPDSPNLKAGFALERE